MTRGQYRTLHKWIFIFMGAFILMWCISGILMMLPLEWFGGVNRLSRPVIDYRNVRLSPADAIRRLDVLADGQAEVKRVHLVQIHDRPVYRIRTDDNDFHYIDGLTGDVFEFTPALAEAIPRSLFAITAPAIETTRLTAHDASYPAGPLPAYRVRFEDAPAANLFVHEQDGRVVRMTATARLRNGIMSLHTLNPLESLTHSAKLRKTLLVSTAVVTLLGAIIGYILTLPGGNRSRPPIR